MKMNQGKQIVIRPTVRELEEKKQRMFNMFIMVLIIGAAIAMSTVFIVVSTSAFANGNDRSTEMTSEVKQPEPIEIFDVDDVEAPEPPQNASEEELKMQEEMVEEINEKERQEAEEIAVQEQAAKVAEEQKQTQVSSPVTSGSYSGSYFKKMGVINENGWRYTWYSSNRAYHYRTPEWTPDENGVYRDSAGYVVVACVADSDGNKISQGSTVPTPFGTGKVYDCGCDAGTIDVYVNF